MVVVSISKNRRLHPAHKKHGGGAWGLEETEERWVSSHFLEIIRTGLLCRGAGKGAGGSAVAEVTGATAKAMAARQCRHFGRGKLFSILPPPSAMSARTGGALSPLSGWSIRPSHSEDGGSCIRAKSDPEILTARARAGARTPWEALEVCASAPRQMAVGVEHRPLVSRTHCCY